MSDFEFVDPVSGAALGAHAFGVVAAGTASTAWAVRLRYKWGQTGSGVNSNALVLLVSYDGGPTWAAATTEFTLAITSVVNVPVDPLFTERVRSLGRGSRWALAPFRAGCALDMTVTFTPDKRTGAALAPLRWKLGIDPNVSFRAVGETPDAPYGVLSGLGCPDVNEWITAPTLANGTNLVTMGACAYVHAGIRREIAGGIVAHSQVDSAGATLAAAQEYIAIQSVGATGRTVTKGVKAAAGLAVPPAIPAGELPEATIHVPYGGVIVTSTLHAVSGRCAVADAGGLVVTVQPGRVSVPGYLVTAPIQQTVTLVDSSVAATGLITCVAKASLIDGETVTISDGTHTPVVFEFDVAGDGVAGGNVQVNVSTDTTAIDVAARLWTAIDGAGGASFAITAVDNLDGTIGLTNNVKGAAGNVAITDTVAAAGFTHTGMAGGLDGSYTVRMAASGTAGVTDGAPLATVTVVNGDIASLVDARRLLNIELVRLRVAGNESAATAVDRIYLPWAWTIDSGTVRVRTASTGATGSTDVNVQLGGVTAFSGSIAAQGTSAAMTLTSTTGAAGWLTLDVAAITTGGTRAVDIEVELWIARL